MRVAWCSLVLISCAANTPEPALGHVIPTTVNYMTGNGGATAVVQFSDDVRNDCTAADQHMNYGNLALLSVFSTTDFAKGQLVPWMTKGQSQGAAAPVAFFSLDGLSGLDLTGADGGVTVVDVPSNTPDKSYKLHLVASDNRLDATFSVPPLCP